LRFIFLVFLILSFAEAQTLYQKGKSVYMSKGCYSCHGNNLEGLHKYPKLSNRTKGFLSYKLKRFRDKISDNQQQEMMIAFAVNLSDEEIENLTIFMQDFVQDTLNQKYNDTFLPQGDGGS
jgi:cytochrome c553